jgi:CheY-like chemotaxis protein
MTRILVAEDDQAVRENIIELLELEGYDVSSAINGQEALMMALSELFDLMICDVMMPVLDGFEVLTRLRKHPSTRALPVIFLTAKTERENQREGMDIGADDYITKPFTRMELLNSIQTRLKKSIDNDTSALNRVQSVDSMTNLLLPLELSEPLSNVLATSERLMDIRDGDSAIRTRHLAGSIRRSAQLMRDISQKYLYLHDLERRYQNDRTSLSTAGTKNTEIHIQEIFLTKLDNLGGHLQIETMETFDCSLPEEDLYMFFDFLLLGIIMESKMDEPVCIRGRLSKENQTYTVEIAYTFDPIRDTDRKLKPYYNQLDKSEWLAMIRIANYLSIGLDFSSNESTGNVLVSLPTPATKDG